MVRTQQGDYEPFSWRHDRGPTIFPGFLLILGFSICKMPTYLPGNREVLFTE